MIPLALKPLSKKKNKIFFWFFIPLLIITSCTSKPATVKEYLTFLNNPDNKLVALKKINGLEIKVKYLPPGYLTYLEESKDDHPYSPQKIDSLLKSYSKSKTFLMTIGQDKESGGSGDVMMRGIASYSEYKERIMNMNFHMENNVVLKTEYGDFYPVLSTLENSYGLSESISFYFVFADNEKSKNLNDSKEFNFTYSDETFGLGINHFFFSKKDMNNIDGFVSLKNPSFN